MQDLSCVALYQWRIQDLTLGGGGHISIKIMLKINQERTLLYWYDQKTWLFYLH